MPETERGTAGAGAGAAGHHVVLYRAWRPNRFGEVVGQAHVTRTLRNALTAGRVAHAYLFCGPRGTGKTSVAKILARAVNCLDPDGGEPCGACAACAAIASGAAVDVLEIDAASHRGIDEIRDLREKARYAPAALRRKVYIVDEVHMLTQEAFNALLKTLEEPPASVIFVLATTDPHKVPPTIISRCQRFDFHRLTPREIAGRLSEVCARLGVRAADGVLERIARHAEGGLRDALSLLDQGIAFAGDELTDEHLEQLLGLADRDEVRAAVRALAAGDPVAVLGAVEQVYRRGRDLRQFVRELVAAFRDVLLARVAPAVAGEADGGGRDPALTDLARLPAPRLLELVQGLSRLEAELRWAPQVRLHLEVGLLALLAAPPGGGGPGEAGAGERAGGSAAGRAADPAGPGGPARREGAAAPAARRQVPGRGAPPGTGATAPRPARPAPGPAAPSAPVPAARPAGEGDDVRRLQAAWDAVRERVRRTLPVLGQYLGQCRPVALEGQRVVLAGGEIAFFRDLLSDPAKRRLVEDAVREVLGRPLAVTLAPGAAGGAGPGGMAGRHDGGPGQGSVPAEPEREGQELDDLLGGFGTVVQVEIDGEEA